MDDALTPEFLDARPELTAYLCRLVLRPQLAEELVQSTYLRCLEARQRLPESSRGLRAWLFKVATHLAIDELRRHRHQRETLLSDLRSRAETDAAFMAASAALVGTPETRAIAREHVVACLACTLRNLPEHKAAALLLSQVHGFSLAETAELLELTPVQVKNHLQQARAHMDARYGASCALLSQQGICHQCVELDGFFAAAQGNPLQEDAGLDARLRLATQLRRKPWGRWHTQMLSLLDELQ